MRHMTDDMPRVDRPIDIDPFEQDRVSRMTELAHQIESASRWFMYVAFVYAVNGALTFFDYGVSFLNTGLSHRAASQIDLVTNNIAPQIERLGAQLIIAAALGFSALMAGRQLFLGFAMGLGFLLFDLSMLYSLEMEANRDYWINVGVHVGVMGFTIFGALQCLQLSSLRGQRFEFAPDDD